MERQSRLVMPVKTAVLRLRKTKQTQRPQTAL